MLFAPATARIITLKYTLNAEEIEHYVDKMLACTSCVVHCRHRNTLGGEGPEYSTIGLLGANLGIAPTDQVITLNNLVNDLGLDASSTGTIIGWAMELYQRGLIDEELTDGPLEWGDYERVHDLIEDIGLPARLWRYPRRKRPGHRPFST